MIYLWKHSTTGKIVEHDHPTNPPKRITRDGVWQRVYSFGVGRVEGGGGSPPRVSIPDKDSDGT